MSQIIGSPLFLENTLFYIFNKLEDREILDKSLVCKFWHKIARDLHQTNNRNMLGRMVQMMSPGELLAKTGLENVQQLEKCACKMVRKLFKDQSEEIDFLNSIRDPKIVHVEPLSHSENFFINHQNIRDYNLGIFLSPSLHKCNEGQTNLVEVGKAARLVIKDIDTTPSPESPNIFNLSMIGFLGCGLTEFSPEVCLLHKNRENPLLQLILSKNRLSYLPEEIKDLSHLQKLELDNNAFQVFPKPILELKNLQELNLSNNPLTDVPPEILELTALKKINLSRTCIQSFPTKIMFCKNEVLVNAMLPHLFAELIVKLCENNFEALYNLMCLLPKETQLSIITDYVQHSLYNKEFSPFTFFNTLKDGQIHTISLLLAFIKGFHNLPFVLNRQDLNLAIWNYLQSQFSKWTPESFENASVEFLNNPLPSSVQITNFKPPLSDEECLQAVCLWCRDL